MLDFSKSSKVIIFTDLHFGIHSNSQSYIDICSNTMKWIKEYAEENSIPNIVFMGDFFDSRASIDVKTLKSATESLYSMADGGSKVTMILGNHDIYLRDSTSIHSLFAFEGHNGIEVVDSAVVSDGLSLLPWQFGTSSGEKIEVPNDLKYVFCHHNFPVDFFLGGNSKKRKKHSDTFVSNSKYEDDFGMQNGIIEKVVDNKGIIFSGHIHKRMEIPIASNGVSKIVIEGSPYETNWGFGGADCGMYVLDVSDGSHEFIDNPHNKKHVEIRSSTFDDDFSKVDFNNSIVRLNVDVQESFDKISKMQSKIQSMKPFAVENTKYEFTAAEFGESNASLDESNPSNSISHGVASKLDYVIKAIDEHDFSCFGYVDSKNEKHDIMKDRLKDIAEGLFERV